MVWVLLLGALLGLLVVADRRAERRRRADLARSGVPVRRLQPPRGVGWLGEAPAGVHHRLGGRSSRD